MSSKQRLDLTGMQPGDAAALRRFAYVVERNRAGLLDSATWTADLG